MTVLDTRPAPRRSAAWAASGPSPAVTVLLTAVAYFMVMLDALVVVTALPSIHRDLGGTLDSLQWTISAYNTAFAAGIITAAAVGDRIGRRRVYTFGLASFTAASAACALAPNAGVLIGCRVIQGLGAAIVVPLGLTLLTSAFPARRRGAVVGIWGGIAGLAVAAGPLVGGAVTQGLSWHWIFWVNVPIGLAAAVGARLLLPESFGPRTRLDLPALALVASGVGLLVWGLVRGPQAGWNAPRVVLALGTGAALLVMFVLWEARTTSPMIPLGLFRTRTFAAALGTQFLTSGSIFSAAFVTSQYLQLGQGHSPLATGLRFLPWTATPLLVAPAAGALFDRVGACRLVVPGLLMQAAGLVWIARLAGTADGYGSYVAPFLLAGIGVSMALPCLPAAALNAAPPALLGKAAGVMNTVQLFGSTLGVALVTVVFTANGSLAGPTAVTDGFRPALAVSAGLSTLGAVTALGIRRTTRATSRGRRA